MPTYHLPASPAQKPAIATSEAQRGMLQQALLKRIQKLRMKNTWVCYFYYRLSTLCFGSRTLNEPRYRFGTEQKFVY